jgi:hypothetical protein
MSSKKTIKVEYEGKKDRKNWVDGNVETFIALCGGNGAKISEEWQKNKVRAGNPKPNIHNKTCKSCFKSLYLFCFEFF